MAEFVKQHELTLTREVVDITVHINEEEAELITELDQLKNFCNQEFLKHLKNEITNSTLKRICME